MSTTLRIRIPDELAAEIERLSEEEQLDTSAVARRLLEQAVTDHRREQAFDRYERSDISLETLAATADLPRQRTLTELRDRDIHFQYSADSLREDAPDASGRGWIPRGRPNRNDYSHPIPTRAQRSRDLHPRRLAAVTIRNRPTGRG